MAMEAGKISLLIIAVINGLINMCPSRINTDNSQNIPNFHTQGKPNSPEVLSNKVVLTPPAPGNQRAGIWTEKPLQHTIWTADVDFRANGPERGGGNLNIWLVKEGSLDIGSGSIYTVGIFEGLALVIDTHGGSGGMIRGFLNDGTTNYKSSQVDGLSFGHCAHAYRNLGRPSQIKFRQTQNNFRVDIDGQLCFESDKISIPAGYHLGITAASADNPDSFEVFKMVVMTDNLEPDKDYTAGTQQQQILQDQTGTSEQAKEPYFMSGRKGAVSDSKYGSDLPDIDAGKIDTSGAQFADLHTRLQDNNHHLLAIWESIELAGTMAEKRHAEMAVQVGELKGLMSKLDKIGDLEKKISNLETEVRRVKGEVSNKVQSSEKTIKNLVSDTHGALHEAVRQHASPGHGRLIAVIIGSQVLLVGGYVYYKKKKSSPKKYL